MGKVWLYYSSAFGTFVSVAILFSYLSDSGLHMSNSSFFVVLLVCIGYGFVRAKKEEIKSKDKPVTSSAVTRTDSD